MMLRAVAIIPARYASVRFPGKILARIAGKPMIQWVWERTSQASRIREVIVATDDDRVAEAVADFGGHVIMTLPDHQTGTERVAEASDKIESDIIVNVQGDEPLIHPESIDLVVQPLIQEEITPMSTLKFPILSYAEFIDPNVVKVVCDGQENAIYFSRSPIPHFRGKQPLLEQWEKEGIVPEDLEPAPMKHIGIYAYRTDFLQAVARMPKSALEKAEALEQLRILDWGFKVKVVTTPHDSISVDVPEDVTKVEAVMRKQGIA